MLALKLYDPSPLLVELKARKLEDFSEEAICDNKRNFIRRRCIIYLDQFRLETIQSGPANLEMSMPKNS